MNDTDVLLFDLGGVLIELTGVPTMMKWSDLSEEALWSRWLHSDAVRQFESGRSTAAEFARAMVAEFELGVGEEDFMEAFVAWPRGPYEGAEALLRSLSSHYRLACLSNTNELHWQRFLDETTLLDCFEQHFPSHQTGMIKPDIEVYEHAIAELDTAPERILFLDDNRINVDAAARVGIDAVVVKALDGVRQVLADRRLTSPAPAED